MDVSPLKPEGVNFFSAATSFPSASVTGFPDRVKKAQEMGLISREDYYAAQSEKFISETFDGSLPAFFAAFTKRKNISPKELQEIRRMIDSFEEG